MGGVPPVTPLCSLAARGRKRAWTPGTETSGAVDCRFEHAGQSLRTPPVPRAVPAGRVARLDGRGTLEEVADEPLYRGRVCGIDIGKAGMAATIRVPSDRDPARRMAETRMFGTTKREVLALADWLRCWQVPAVVMEATGGYWKPVVYRLGGGGVGGVLADARQGKKPPGRPQPGPAERGVRAGGLQARQRAAVFRRRPGVPGDPAAHPVPEGPDRGTDPGETAGREAAGVRGDQGLLGAVGPARGDRPGHHGPPDSRGTRPEGAG